MMTLLRLAFGAIAVSGVLIFVFLGLINAAHPTHFPFGYLLAVIGVCAVFAASGVRR
jgi:hypothetical protein